MQIKRPVRILFACVALWLLYKAAAYGKVLVEKYWPMSPAMPNVSLSIQAALNNESDYWSQPSEAVELEWRNSQGFIPGKVQLLKWQHDSQIFYKISGPLNPDYKAAKSDLLICTIYLAHGLQVEQWNFELTTNQPTPKTPGCELRAMRSLPVRQILPTRYYNFEIKNSYFELTVAVPPETKLGNAVYRYEEDSVVGWVATERDGAARHDNIFEWILQ